MARTCGSAIGLPMASKSVDHAACRPSDGSSGGGIGIAAAPSECSSDGGIGDTSPRGSSEVSGPSALSYVSHTSASELTAETAECASAAAWPPVGDTRWGARVMSIDGVGVRLHRCRSDQMVGRHALRRPRAVHRRRRRPPARPRARQLSLRYALR